VSDSSCTVSLRHSQLVDVGGQKLGPRKVAASFRALCWRGFGRRRESAFNNLAARAKQGRSAGDVIALLDALGHQGARSLPGHKWGRAVAALAVAAHTCGREAPVAALVTGQQGYLVSDSPRAHGADPVRQI